MQEKNTTAGKTAWKESLSGKTMVVFRDCHWAHNTYTTITGERQFRRLARRCTRAGHKFVISERRAA